MENYNLRPPFPNVVRKGGFTLIVYAHQKLTYWEANYCMEKYLAENHLKRVPKSGKGELWAEFGFDEL